MEDLVNFRRCKLPLQQPWPEIVRELLLSVAVNALPAWALPQLYVLIAIYRRVQVETRLRRRPGDSEGPTEATNSLL